ncbi:MAG: hypothetical protein ABS28_07970, partial [Cryomorphaceae bacterium BACL22 MAG-120619-bin32]
DGYSIKTLRYSYTEYINPKNNQTIARMLFDHLLDPDENENVAELKVNSEIVKQLNKQLHSSYGKNILGH